MIIRKRILSMITLLSVLLFSMSACTTKTDTALKTIGNTVKIDTSSGKLKLGSKIEKVAENKRFSLIINGTDLNIGLTDSVTGRTWYTNYPESEKDTIALPESIDLLKSQLQIDYYDKNGNYGTMNSYTDCISKGQYEIYSVKNGIVIIYSFGDTSRTVDDVPQKISNDSFTEKLLNKLSQKKQKYLKNAYYTYYESEDMWTISNIGRKNYRTILKFMDEAGYSDVDLQKDHQKYGISISSTTKIRFSITVCYTLTDSGLSVSIPCDRITYNNNYPPFNIALLPNFGAQRLSDQTKNGFILIPDGSGALMRFDSKLSPEYYYDAPVYGYDEVVTLRQNSNNVQSQQVSLPVFGMSNGSAGFIARISDGAANATVTATRAGKSSEQFTVNPVFAAINMDYVKLNGSSSATTTAVFQSDIYSGSFTVEYLPTTGGTYSDMASVLRNRFEQEKLIRKINSSENNLPFYLETIGGVWGSKSFLGLSYSGVVRATSYEQNVYILKALTERGVMNLKLKLLGWCNKGMYGDCTADVKLIGALGGKRGFKKLKSYCESAKIGFYPDAGLIRGGTGSGQKTSNVARTLDSRTVDAVQRMYLSDDLPSIINYAYSPSRLLGLSERFLHSCSKLDLKTVSLSDSGSVIYSDYNDTLKRQYDRAEAEHYIVRQLADVAAKTDSIMINTGNLYSLAYIDYAINVATDDSWMICEDCAIPFLQLVLHGRVNLGSKAINLQTDENSTLLRCAEYGVAPLYQLSYCETTVLSKTSYSENYSSCYTDWLESSVKNWSTLNKVLADLQTATMMKHKQITDKVACTQYDNGCCIYVNYGDNNYTVDGVTVPPRGIIRKEGV